MGVRAARLSANWQCVFICVSASSYRGETRCVFIRFRCGLVVVLLVDFRAHVGLAVPGVAGWLGVEDYGFGLGGAGQCIQGQGNGWRIQWDS